ncbi:MAG: ECF transporter S component [Clostridiales bacterium]|nr:ECF transporter S component [Clostridiales bacterium]
MKTGFFQRFTLFELILLAFLAAAGIAVKPLVAAVFSLLTGPIPGGALAGGIYMLFIVLGGALVGKRGAATMVALVQSLMVFVTAIPGSHGAASLITYTVPGLAVDLLWFLLASRGAAFLPCFFGGMAANISGTFLTGLIILRLPLTFLLFALALAAFSGGVGGLVTWQIVRHVGKLNVFPHLKALDGRGAARRAWLAAGLSLTILLAAITGLWFVNGGMNYDAQAIAFKAEGQEAVVVGLDFLLALESHDFKAVIRSSGQKPKEVEYTGVLLADVLQALDIETAGKTCVLFKGADAYLTGLYLSEFDGDNVYIAYASGGEYLEPKGKKGFGPFLLVILNDNYSQRWCKYLCEVEIK